MARGSTIATFYQRIKIRVRDDISDMRHCYIEIKILIIYWFTNVKPLKELR